MKEICFLSRNESMEIKWIFNKVHLCYYTLVGEVLGPLARLRRAVIHASWRQEDAESFPDLLPGYSYATRQKPRDFNLRESNPNPSSTLCLVSAALRTEDRGLASSREEDFHLWGRSSPLGEGLLPFCFTSVAPPSSALAVVPINWTFTTLACASLAEQMWPEGKDHPADPQQDPRTGALCPAAPQAAGRPRRRHSTRVHLRGHPVLGTSCARPWAAAVRRERPSSWEGSRQATARVLSAGKRERAKRLPSPRREALALHRVFRGSLWWTTRELAGSPGVLASPTSFLKKNPQSLSTRLSLAQCPPHTGNPREPLHTTTPCPSPFPQTLPENVLDGGWGCPCATQQFRCCPVRAATTLLEPTSFLLSRSSHAPLASASQEPSKPPRGHMPSQGTIISGSRNLPMVPDLSTIIVPNFLGKRWHHATTAAVWGKSNPRGHPGNTCPKPGHR